MIIDAKGKEFLILDKLRADHSKPVKAWAAERQDKIELFCLPSYGPQLNPEKRLNGDLKQTIGANACAHQGRVEISSHRTHVSDDVCFYLLRRRYPAVAVNEVTWRVCVTRYNHARVKIPVDRSLPRPDKNPSTGERMDIKDEVVSVLDEVLSLKGRASQFTPGTPLLGAIPELDSMAVVALITTLEERFGFIIEDDEIDGSVFSTFGSLLTFVQNKLDG